MKINYKNYAFYLFLLCLVALILQPVFDINIVTILYFLIAVFLINSQGIVKDIDRVDILLFLFIAIVSFGLFYAQDLNIALRRFSLTYLPLFLIYTVSKSQNKNLCRFVVNSMLFVGLAVSIFMIFEFFTGKNFIFQSFFANGYFSTPYFYKNRAFGPFYHPTIAGFFLVTCLPACRLLLCADRDKVKLVVGTISFVCISLAIIATLSKMALIVMFFIYLWYLRQRTQLVKKLILGTFLFLFIAVLSKFNVFRHYFGPDIFFITFKYRLMSLATAIRMIVAHPFLGVGLDHFRLLFFDYVAHPIRDYFLRAPDNMIPDNMYLMVLVENGIFAFLAFILFILSLVKKAILKLIKTKNGSDRVLVEVIFVSFLAAFVHIFSFDAFYWSTPLILFWMFAGFLQRLCHKKEL